MILITYKIVVLLMKIMQLAGPCYNVTGGSQ